MQATPARLRLRGGCCARAAAARAPRWSRFRLQDTRGGSRTRRSSFVARSRLRHGRYRRGGGASRHACRREDGQETAAREQGSARGCGSSVHGKGTFERRDTAAHRQRAQRNFPVPSAFRGRGVRRKRDPQDPSHRIGRTLQGAFACGAAARDPGRGVCASELGHGAQDLGGFGDHDEQGIGDHRSAVALRCKPRADPGRRPSAERGAFDGRVRRRFRDRPARAPGHAHADRPGARLSRAYRRRSVVARLLPHWGLELRAARFRALSRPEPRLCRAQKWRGRTGHTQRGQRGCGSRVSRRPVAVLAARRSHRGDARRSPCESPRHARGCPRRRCEGPGTGEPDRDATESPRRMNLAVTLLAFIVALGVLIVFHEFGHYLIARLFGVKVLRFSIGFGKSLWRGRSGRDRTEWVIAALPLGGYVKMLDEREGPVAPEEVHRAFNRQGVWRRIAIVAGGPAANFLLAIVFYWALFVGGVEEAKPVGCTPEAGTVAGASGLKRCWTVLKINDEPMASWQQVRWRLLQLAVEKQPARLEVIDPKQRLTWRTLDLSNFDLEGFDSDPLARLGLRLDRPDVAPVIGKVVPGSVAEAAGLRAGDRVVSIDGGEIRVWEDVVRVVRRRPGEIVRLGIVRSGSQIEVQLRPETVQQNGERFGRIGTAPQMDPESMKGLVTTVRYAPAAALEMALARTWEMSAFSLKMLGKMIIGQVSWKNLSGPVTIADYAGQSAQLGIGAYVAFLALISISLGVLNLLPIPLLDGGHLLYYAVEIFKGSPASERAMELGQRLGLTLLLFLMAFAIFDDFNRSFAG